jgi:hypothetical protein
MTQIRGFIGATRRPGELGVHSLDEFNLVVPDIKLAETFYSEFGLELQVRGNRLDVHTHGHNHRWGTIVEGSRKRLSHLSFGVFEDDFPRFKERLNNLRLPLLEAPPGFESNGLWFHSPDGLLMVARRRQNVAERKNILHDGECAGRDAKFT